eukprot:2086545-Ditylum_brightwellii.AAC.1
MSTRPSIQPYDCDHPNRMPPMTTVINPSFIWVKDNIEYPSEDYWLPPRSSSHHHDHKHKRTANAAFKGALSKLPRPMYFGTLLVKKETLEHRDDDDPNEQGTNPPAEIVDLIRDKDMLSVQRRSVRDKNMFLEGMKF